MNCTECLTALATESLREMTPDSPVLKHCATCPDCARLTTLLRDKEYETATLLNTLPPMSNPLTVAENAVSMAQRRRVGRVAVMLSGAALVVTLWFVGARIVYPIFDDSDRRVAGVITEIIPLTCLSPQQAGDIIEPYLTERGRYYAPASGINTITVRARPAEVAKSRELIAQFENDPSAACRAPLTIIRRLQDQMSRSQGAHPDPNPNPDPDKATTTLLGKQRGEPLLDLNTPPGTGPVIPPTKASTAPKKQ